MAFWKKSDDPWDMEPKKPAQPKQEEPGIFDELREDFRLWKEELREEKRRRETPVELTCPWCGKPMVWGYLQGSRGIWWVPGAPTAKGKWLGAGFVKGTFRVDAAGELFDHQTAWCCPDCERLVVDIHQKDTAEGLAWTTADTPPEETPNEQEGED